MVPDVVVLPRSIVNQILTHAIRSRGVEVCGLVSAVDNTPEKVYPIRNCAEDTTVQYEMDPKQLIDAMRTIRDSNESLFAIYHSHPSTDAYPSPLDIEQAAYPEAVYLIVSLGIGGVMDMRGYRVDNNHVKSIVIEIE